MFDRLRPDASGFLPGKRERATPGLESLEAREVPAVIGGMVYQDVNANGLFDTGEQGIANSRILLQDANGQVIATTQSDATGRYVFTQRGNAQVTPGTVTREVVFDTSKTNHTRNATVAQFDGAQGTLTAVEIIAEGAFDTAVQMENLEGSSAQVQAKLKGSFRFQVGSTVLEAAPETVLQDTLSAYDGTADLSGTSARDFGVTRLAGNFTRTVLTNPSDLSQFVGSGTINVAETANMASCSCGTGNLLSAVRTTASGKVRVVYHYTPSGSLETGSYTVVQTPQPAGYIDGQETGDNVTAIPNSNRTDFIRVTITEFSQQSTQNHFGELRASTLSGRVYHDRDKGGTWNTGDVGIARVSVLLSGTDQFGNAVNRSTFTNALGMYAFTNLAPGTYTIREIQPAGYLQGTNSTGTPAGEVSGDTITVTVPQGTNGVEYDFGEIRNSATPPPNPIVTPPITRPSKFILFGGFGGW